MPKPAAWEPEKVRLFKELWESGVTTDQMAKQMGLVSKNVVVGRVRRLGLDNRPSPIGAKRGRPRKDSKPVKRADDEDMILPPLPNTHQIAAPSRYRGGSPVPSAHPSSPPAVFSRCRDCQWIEGNRSGPIWTVEQLARAKCDQAAIDGIWCADHRLRVYEKAHAPNLEKSYEERLLLK